MPIIDRPKTKITCDTKDKIINDNTASGTCIEVDSNCDNVEYSEEVSFFSLNITIHCLWNQ